MTIGTTTIRVSFNCDGVTKVFPVPLQSYLASDFEVVLTAPASAGGASTVLVLNSDYSMVASSTDQPPKWTMTTLATNAYAAGYTLQAIAAPVENQQTQYVQGQAFPSLAVQTNFDRLTQMVLRLQDQVNRSLVAPDGDVNPVMALPNAQTRKNTYQGYDANGNSALFNLLTAGTVLSLATLAPLLSLNQTAAEAAAGVIPTNVQFPPGHPWRYGAVDDGATNCNTALQNWINVGQRGVPLQFPAVLGGGGYLITVPLSITVGVNIQGGGWERSALICIGCDGFQIAAGVAQVIMQNFRINLNVRYQQPNGVVTANSFAAIRILGSTGSQNAEHLYRDLFFDGFGTYFVGGGLQFSLIDNCQGYFGLQGIVLTGTPADVTIRGGIYQCGNLAPTGAMLALQPSGVQVGGGGAGDAAQGCVIEGTTLTGFFADVWLLGANFCHVLGCQLDFANGYNVLVQPGALASCCHNIGNNYMALTANGFYGVRLLNSVVSSFKEGNRVHGNTMLMYAAGASRGISIEGSQEQNNIIFGNTINVGSVADIQVLTDAGAAPSHTIVGNTLLGLGILASVPCTYVGNVGAYLSNPETFVLTPLYSSMQTTITPFGASQTPNFQTTNSQLIIPTSPIAFTIQNPINPPARGGLKARIWILNASGGALGAVTWGSAYKVPAGITYPNNGFRRCYEFELLGAGGNYYLTVSPTVDIPN